MTLLAAGIFMVDFSLSPTFTASKKWPLLAFFMKFYRIWFYPTRLLKEADTDTGNNKIDNTVK
ncbi:hypothetical protein [Candidatus Regiella endosymbiont of Tuberolachnus salignus]|uniref:hypothetical protein n=1 Tax=Candidatus Regiella endosymbiont of Tuberolachnus salignus TaxID=3077956 RepID=UPI0030D0348F